MYEGINRIVYNDQELAQFYSENIHTLNVKENEYVVIYDANTNEAIDYYIHQDGRLLKLGFPAIGNEFTGVIKPRNPEQYCAFDLLNRKNIPIKLITGKFGVGKTLGCVTAALEQVQRGLFEKIIFIRNNVQVKDTDPLGSLPGDVYDKTLPFLLPFADHCGGIDGLKALIDNEQLEALPLAFLRGRSIRNSIIYSMESENLTKEHIQLIMGRVDEGSQLWMDGDIRQRDKATFEKSAGLETMVERLAGNKLFGYVHLCKSERSAVSALADLLD